MLSSFKLDVAETRFWLRGCERKVWRGEPQVNAKGVAKWSVDLIMQTPESNGDIRVTVSADTNPCEGIDSLTQVKPVNLEIGQWTRGERSGIYFTADAIEKEDESNA